MATITWTGAAHDGNFNNPANWSPMQVPGAADNAVISPSATTTITAANDTLGGLTLSKTVTLDIANNSNLTIGNGSASTTLSNAGTLVVNSLGNATTLVFADTTTMLNGGGQVVLVDNSQNYIYGASAADTLNNVNNTISGAGQLGNGQLTLINGSAGIINATGTNALVVNTGTIAVTNSGLLEATGAGGLVLDGTINDGLSGHISAAGGIVTLNGSTVQGGTLASSGGGQININNGALDGSAHTISNTGSVQIDNNNVGYVLGTLNNTGTLSLASIGNATGFIVDSGTVTLMGGGTVATSDEGGDNYFQALAAGDVLNNVDNKLNLSGNFGNNSALTVVNSGTINANQTHVLTLELASTLTNNKLLEETNTGGIAINGNTDVLNATGTISAVGAGGVSLNGGAITGGHLTSGAGTFYSNNGTLDGKTLGAITTSAAIQVDNNNVLYALGTLVNSGTITLASIGNVTGFIVDSATVTLTGSGVLATADEGQQNYFAAAVAGDTLINLNNHLNISGDFGNDSGLLVTNSGTINANQTHALTLQLGATLTNKGLIEATGAGGIVVNADTIVSNAAGTIAAKASAISLNGGTIVGGLISSTGTGSFYSNNGTLDGLTKGAITSSAAVQVDNNNVIYVSGTLANSGTITLASAGNSTGFIIDSPTLTVTGGGVITSTDEGYDNYFQGLSAGYELNNVDNTLNLSGNFGNGQLTFINSATVNANQAHALVLNTGGSFTNNALVEETSTGGIVVNGNTTISNGSTGTIAATGAGGILLQNNATIAGGVLTSGTGTFYSNNGTLDGSSNTITSRAAIQVNNNQNLYALGTLANSGTITLASGGNSTGFIIDSPTLTLTGGGVITSTDEGYDNYFYGAAAGYELNNVNNTLDLSGNFGNGQLVFVNSGTLNANQTHALVLNTGETFTNNALVEETGSGGIVVDGNTTINNGSTGTVAVTGAGGITLANGATIAGGTIVGGAGTIYSNNGTLDGSSHAITTSAAIQVDNNANFYALGTLVNSGTITLDSGGNSTGFVIDSPTLTLTGSGLVTTSNEGNDNYFAAAVSGDVLNNVSNTFNISGNFGNASGLVVQNAGVFEDSQSNRLYINTAAAFTNSGQLIAAGAGGIDLRNVVLTNGSTGTISALGGSTLVSEGGGTLTNDSSTGTLSGGTYEALANASAATLNFNGHAIVSLSADVVLSGTGAEISFGGVAIETDLSMISKTGELQILAGRNYTSKKIITNYGTIALGGGVFKPYALNTAPGSLVSGFGTIASKAQINGSLVATGGTLDLTGSVNTINGAVSGTGTLALGGTTTLGTKTTLAVSNIVLLSKATLDLGESVSFAGTFNVTGAATLAGPGTFTSTGLFESTGKGVGTITAPFSNSGTISVASNTTLAFSGGLANTGLILDSGTFTDTAAVTGGSLTLGGTSSHATIATTAGTGNSTLATLTSAGGALNTSGTTLTVTGDYNNTASGIGNSYNPFAGVTGTIDAKGTQLAVVGVNGTTITSVNGTLTIAIAAHGTASFVIENAGPTTDTLLRGALQTSVNGASITSKSLSGTGVKAGNYGPLAGGSETGTYTIAYNGSMPLTGQAIHIASDFANVAGLTIDIVAQGAGAAPPAGGSLPDVSHGMADLMVVSKG